MPSFETMKKKQYQSQKTVGQMIKDMSDDTMNETFKSDVQYKKVYVLTSNGWEWQDAKYQKHTTPSILKDEVDYYLQFRPKVHFKLGTYVIIPDDTSEDISAPLDDPFDEPVEDRTQWWLIVGRTDAAQFVRYSVLKCNWDFTWIYNGRISHCYGCVRNSNSYTSCTIRPFVLYTARCNRKLCSVFCRICWKTLRAAILKQRDEKSSYGIV